MTLTGKWQREQLAIPAGSLFVPTTQPLTRLAMALLEPTAADSFAAWGLFNSCFEMKESFEPYVAEQIAREMLGRVRPMVQGAQVSAPFGRVPVALEVFRTD